MRKIKSQIQMDKMDRLIKISNSYFCELWLEKTRIEYMDQPENL